MEQKIVFTGKPREILRLLFQKQHLTRKQLAEAAGWSPITIAKTIAPMIESGLLIESYNTEVKKGRKPLLLSLNPDYGYVVGIDIGTYAIKIGIVGLNGAIQDKELIKPENQGQTPAIYPSLDELQESVRSLVEKHGDNRLLGIGIGISGLVDYDTQTIMFCPNIVGFNKLDISRLLGERFHVPVIVDTSARCMAIGEKYFGSGEELDDLSFISVGYSVAVGTIIGNKVFRGNQGFAGELGHVKVTADSGFVCTCGSTDCAEGFVTLPMVYRDLQMTLTNYRGYSALKDRFDATGEVSYQDIARAYLARDKLVLEVLGKAVEYLATMIANYVNLFNPKVLALGGGFFSAFPFLCPEIERGIHQKGLTLSLQNLRIYCSGMTEDGAIIGSAMQLIQKHLS